MKYPLEHLTDTEFEKLVALICQEVLGVSTVVFSVGKDGGKDARFNGKANNFPSKSKPWDGKIIIQAKHTQRANASCSNSDFQSIIKTSVIPAINKLKNNNELDYYLLFTNRKLSGIQDAKIEDLFDTKINTENRLIGLETIQLWLDKFPVIVKTLNLNKLLLPLNFEEEDLKHIVNSFSNLDKQKGDLSKIPKNRDIENKNKLNELSKDYFDNVIKRNLIYFEQISAFLMDSINKKYLEKYENTIDDINAKITIHRRDFEKFEMILEFLYDYVIGSDKMLNDKRRLVRLFLHYMYYNCDIGINE